jgi:hypothetical protein
MSAGELEHEWAGTPGKLIRERYRKASDMSKVREMGRGGMAINGVTLPPATPLHPSTLLLSIRSEGR